VGVFYILVTSTDARTVAQGKSTFNVVRLTVYLLSAHNRFAHVKLIHACCIGAVQERGLRIAYPSRIQAKPESWWICGTIATFCDYLESVVTPKPPASQLDSARSTTSANVDPRLVCTRYLHSASHTTIIVWISTSCDGGTVAHLIVSVDFDATQPESVVLEELVGYR